MTKEQMRSIAEQAIRELKLAGIKVVAVKRPPYDGDPTWWIDLTERGGPSVFQVFVTLAPNETDDSIREKIKRQLGGHGHHSA